MAIPAETVSCSYARVERTEWATGSRQTLVGAGLFDKIR
jgi:hypothetical protein